MSDDAGYFFIIALLKTKQIHVEHDKALRLGYLLLSQQSIQDPR